MDLAPRPGLPRPDVPLMPRRSPSDVLAETQTVVVKLLAIPVRAFADALSDAVAAAEPLPPGQARGPSVPPVILRADPIATHRRRSQPGVGRASRRRPRARSRRCEAHGEPVRIDTKRLNEPEQLRVALGRHRDPCQPVINRLPGNARLAGGASMSFTTQPKLRGEPAPELRRSRRCRPRGSDQNQLPLARNRGPAISLDPPALKVGQL